jgi:hypothetical protein
MLENFPERIEKFIKTANKNDVQMILVGGGAVNFHGYQRHSADIDFWINATPENMQNLLRTLQEIGYNIANLPEDVQNGEQNISIKVSPVFEMELITRFNPGKSFKEAYAKSETVKSGDIHYHVLNFYDLIQSKISSDRPKDKLDVEELHRIRLKRKK